VLKDPCKSIAFCRAAYNYMFNYELDSLSQAEKNSVDRSPKRVFSFSENGSVSFFQCHHGTHNLLLLPHDLASATQLMCLLHFDDATALWTSLFFLPAKLGLSKC
jgi:hypothetical protein